MSGRTAFGDGPATARARGVSARLHRFGKALAGEQRLLGGRGHGTRSIVTALGAYLPTRALGLHEGFWAAIGNHGRADPRITPPRPRQASSWPAQAMRIARVSEVGWGVCVAVAVVWLFGRAGALARRPIRPRPSPSP